MPRPFCPTPFLLSADPALTTSPHCPVFRPPPHPSSCACVCASVFHHTFHDVQGRSENHNHHSCQIKSTSPPSDLSFRNLKTLCYAPLSLPHFPPKHNIPSFSLVPHDLFPSLWTVGFFHLHLEYSATFTAFSLFPYVAFLFRDTPLTTAESARDNKMEKERLWLWNSCQGCTPKSGALMSLKTDYFPSKNVGPISRSKDSLCFLTISWSRRLLGTWFVNRNHILSGLSHWRGEQREDCGSFSQTGK